MQKCNKMALLRMDNLCFEMDNFWVVGGLPKNPFCFSTWSDGIHPLVCRFYTLSDPEINPNFVLSINFELNFKLQYEKSNANNWNYADSIPIKRTTNQTIQ